MPLLLSLGSQFHYIVLLLVISSEFPILGILIHELNCIIYNISV